MKSSEKDWWDQKAQEATNAKDRNDQRELYQILAELTNKQATKKPDGGKWVAAEVEEEREAWRRHFQKVSQGKEEVNPGVWETMDESTRANWLGEQPTDMEMDKCVKQMK